jgi:hypothetical protein
MSPRPQRVNPLPVVRGAAVVLMTIAALGADATLLDSLVRGMAPPSRAVVAEADKYQLQIIYTKVNRDHQNLPHFVTFRFNVDPNRYFYPASLVKLPVAAFALEKIHKIHLAGLTSKTAMVIDTAIGCPIAYDCDSIPGTLANPPGSASIESSIKRMLLVSDNMGFNRLWDFVTRDRITTRLSQCGYGKFRILHRLWSCSPEQNRLTNPVTFIAKNGKILYKQPITASKLPDTNPLAPISIGSGRMGYGSMLIPQQLKADNLNYVPLEEAHRFLIALMFPYSVTNSKRPLLSTEDYRLLRTWMCLLPRESGMPRYDSRTDYPDNYKKYLLYGDGTKPIDTNLREFNVVGRAYGFMTDVAYFADFKAKIEFFLSATIYVNEDGIINDNRYEYETIALPFFSALGQTIYNYEISRPRPHRPNLQDFLPAIPEKEASRPMVKVLKKRPRP